MFAPTTSAGELTIGAIEHECIHRSREQDPEGVSLRLLRLADVVFLIAEPGENGRSTIVLGATSVHSTKERKADPRASVSRPFRCLDFAISSVHQSLAQVRLFEIYGNRRDKSPLSEISVG